MSTERVFNRAPGFPLSSNLTSDGMAVPIALQSPTSDYVSCVEGAVQLQPTVLNQFVDGLNSGQSDVMVSISKMFNKQWDTVFNHLMKLDFIDALGTSR
jgi:hypothetical protein